jgi:hypothetical protein
MVAFQISRIEMVKSGSAPAVVADIEEPEFSFA